MTGDHLERWQDDRRSFGKQAGGQEIIWKGGMTTGGHMKRRQGDKRSFGKEEGEGKGVQFCSYRQGRKLDNTGNLKNVEKNTA